MPNKVEYLIVDTSAFIRNAQLQEIATNIITIQEVVNEIKDKRQLRRLVVLPYDLQVKDVFQDNIAIITEFSKKTGDYPCLSATDMKVMALTYQLEKDYVGSEHLRKEPLCPRELDYTNKSITGAAEIAGFYLPKKEFGSKEGKQEYRCDEEFLDGAEEEGGEWETVGSKWRGNMEEEVEEEEGDEEEWKEEECYFGEEIEYEEEEEDEGKGDEFELLDQELESKMEGLILEKIEESDGESGISEEEGEEGDGGWIGPWNVVDAKRGIDGTDGSTESPRVACLTTDFAMQNVLKQMGLTVVALDGQVINQLRTYIFRCYACFKTTSVMTKVFCPNCGHKTLKRVGVTIDSDGKEKMHINLRRPLTARGKRFPLPRPRGGKHALNPILCEDQRIPQQRISKLALKKNNPLDPDYIAGYSPFIQRDVTSKSAMLGFHRKGEFKYWMKKNPNEPLKRRRKK